MEKVVNNQTYKFGKLPALAQFHIVRRLAPVIGDLLPSLTKVAKNYKNAEEMKEAQLSEEEMLVMFTPVVNAISKLSDSDANYVIFELLKNVTRKVTSSGGWAKITTGETLMYEDIDMPTMLRLCGHSLAENLGGFISALPAGLKEGAIQQGT